MSESKEEISLDPLIERYYGLGLEKDRLTQGVFQLEKERTWKILQKSLPSAPAVILDVGGAAGAYAFPLAEQGYEVHLIDPVALHIEQARAHAKEAQVQLASYSVGDARKIQQQDQSADVVLFLGPLYHLVKRQERLQALREAYRVLKPGGVLIAAAISRFSSLIDGLYRGMLLERKFREIVQEDIKTGHHQSEDAKYFTTAYLHRPQQLKEEIKECGFQEITLLAVEGPVWQETVIESVKKDSEAWQQLLSFLEQIETDESIMGASAHLIAVAVK